MSPCGGMNGKIGGMARKIPNLPTLNVIYYKEGRVVVAHCLELDLMGEGSNETKAFRQLISTIVAHLEFAMENGLGDQLYRPAPEEIWKKMASAKFRGRTRYRIKGLGDLKIPTDIRPLIQEAAVYSVSRA